MNLNEQVRYQIGEEGPQLPEIEYYNRIDEQLERMSNAELLLKISNVLEELNIVV
jgi:hypothetical protein